MSDWINVKDRLPEKNTKLLLLDYGDVALGYLSETNLWFAEGYGYDGDNDIAFGVTHWMPIPNLPKE